MWTTSCACGETAPRQLCNPFDGICEDNKIPVSSFDYGFNSQFEYVEKNCKLSSTW